VIKLAYKEDSYFCGETIRISIKFFELEFLLTHGIKGAKGYAFKPELDYLSH
jgi:hypothetical protein